MLSTKAIAVWGFIAAMAATGSFAVAYHQESPPDILETSDVKIHLQDVDGKINTNVPIEASRIFSPLPVIFSHDKEPFSDAVDGSSIVTKQKAVLNFVLNVSTVTHVTFSLDNQSEDPQIFLIKAAAPSKVILDMESGNVKVQGVTGHNEWIAVIDGGSIEQTFNMEVSTTDPGFYPIVVELLRVG